MFRSPGDDAPFEVSVLEVSADKGPSEGSPLKVYSVQVQVGHGIWA